MSDSEPLRFNEVLARKNYPHGVPEGVDPASRLYVPQFRLTARGEDWEGILAWCELSGGTCMTHLHLTHGGFDMNGALDGIELFAPGVVPAVGLTARYRGALTDFFRAKLGREVVVS